MRSTSYFYLFADVTMQQFYEYPYKRTIIVAHFVFKIYVAYWDRFSAPGVEPRTRSPIPALTGPGVE